MEIRIVDSIKRLCKEKDMSIPKLEKEVGLSNGSIYNWNKSYPSIDKVIKVADYFNITIDELIGRNISSEQQRDNNVILAARNKSGELTIEDKVILKRLANLLSDIGIDALDKN